MNKPLERIFNGLVKENPTFVLMLGMCPTLAVTTSAINGLGMGHFDDGCSDYVQPDDFGAAQDHPGWRADAGVHCCCRVVRYNR